MTLIPCDQIREFLSDYREGKLEDAEKAQVEMHLLYCPECNFLLTMVPALEPERTNL